MAAKSTQSKAAVKKTKEKTKRTTVFDDVFRTMAQKMPYLLVPVINEAFGTTYPENVKIEQLRNEHFELNGEIITDALIRIEGVIYHIESQSSNDETMCIRMFEYDTAIAIEQARKKKRKQRDVYEIDYPESCVIYVRSNSKTPDKLQMKVNFPNGESITYETKTIKVSNYSLEEVFIRKLLMLLPYYLIRFESQAKRIEEDPEKLDELLSECSDLMQMLESETKKRRDNLYADLVNFIKKVSDHIFHEEKKIRKGVDKIMGGKVLVLESERLIRKGKKEGGNLMLYSLVEDGIVTPAQAAKKLGITIEELKNKMALTEYKYPINGDIEG